MFFQLTQRNIEEFRGFFIDFINGFWGGVRLQKEIVQRNGRDGLGNFPIGIKKAFADRQVDAACCELADFDGGTIEAMDDPSLFGLVFFVKPKDVGSGADVMDNQRLLILFGKEDVFFEIFELNFEGLFMGAVEARFANSGNLVAF